MADNGLINSVATSQPATTQAGSNASNGGITMTPTSIPAVPQAQAAAEDLSSPQMTIAGNIGNYLDPNSSVNQLLATKAKQAANANGTLNSSMTDSAISNGIIANAQSMAQNDQSVHASGSQTNAQNQNTVNTTNANNASQTVIANMNNANQLAMTNLNNQNKTLLQESSAAANIYQTAEQQIAAIQQNSSMDQATKDTQTANIIATTNAALADQSAMSGLNVGANFAGLSVGGAATTTATAPTTYTAPDGSIWSSQQDFMQHVAAQAFQQQGVSF